MILALLLCLLLAGCLAPPPAATDADAGASCTDCVACCVSARDSDGGGYSGLAYQCELECADGGAP